MSRGPASGERRGVLVPLRRPADEVVDPSDPVEELSDEALVAACAVGEAAALGVLFDRHGDSVARFVARVVCAPEPDIEDLVQSTFIEAWRASGRYRGRGSVRSWLFGIGANMARHYVRGEARRRRAMDGLRGEPMGGGRSVAAEVADAQLVARLARALEKLSHDQRVAFVLCDIEEMSGVEAARVLGVRQGTMWRRLHDARRTLRRLIDGGGQ